MTGQNGKPPVPLPLPEAMTKRQLAQELADVANGDGPPILKAADFLTNQGKLVARDDLEREVELVRQHCSSQWSNDLLKAKSPALQGG